MRLGVLYVAIVLLGLGLWMPAWAHESMDAYDLGAAREVERIDIGLRGYTDLSRHGIRAEPLRELHELGRGFEHAADVALACGIAAAVALAAAALLLREARPWWLRALLAVPVVASCVATLVFTEQLVELSPATVGWAPWACLLAALAGLGAIAWPAAAPRAPRTTPAPSQA